MPFPGQPTQPSTQERKQVDPSPEKKKATTTTVTTTKEVPKEVPKEAPKEVPKEVPQQEDEDSSSEEEDASSEEEEGEESQENEVSTSNPYAGMSHSISQDTKSSPPHEETPKPAKEPTNGDAVKRKIEETTSTSDEGDRADPPKRSKKKSTGPTERILYSASYAFQTEDEKTGKTVITKLPVYIVNGDKVVFATQDLRDIANHNMRIKGEEGKCQITVDKSNKTAAEYEYLVSYLKAHLDADNDVFEVMKRAHDQIMKEWEQHKTSNVQAAKKTESDAAPVVHKTEKKPKAPSTKTKKQSANNNVVEQPPVDRVVEDKIVVAPKAEQPQTTHVHVRKLNLIPPNPVDYLVGDALKQYRAAVNEYFDILQGMN